MRGNFTDAEIIINCNTHEKIFNDLSCYSPKYREEFQIKKSH